MLTSENEEKVETVISSEKEDYISKFQTERINWTGIVKEIAGRFKTVENLAEVQIDLYSRRQESVEYASQLQVLISKIKRKWLTDWKKTYENLTTNEDYRYNEREKNKMADEITGELKVKMEILQSHIDFFRETTKSIDSMIFGVKHRIEIENFKIGNK